MVRGVLAALCVVASSASAQPVAEPPPSPPSPSPARWLAHATMHHGIALVSDSIDDLGATGPGFAFGFQGGVQYRLTPVLSLGAALDLTYSSHGSDASPAAKAGYLHYFPSLVGRFELRRFAVIGWAGYQQGTRRVKEDGGITGSAQFAENDLGGIVAAGAFVVRLRAPTPRPVTLEVGPFVQLARLGAEPDGSTSSVVLGLAFQAVYNAPSIDGDTF